MHQREYLVQIQAASQGLMQAPQVQPELWNLASLQLLLPVEPLSGFQEGLLHNM